MGNVKGAPHLTCEMLHINSAVAKRMPVLRDNQGHWLCDKRNQTTPFVIEANSEMKKMKRQWAKRQK